MTDTITIPPASLEAAAKAAYEAQRRPGEPPWEQLGEAFQNLWRRQQRPACLAMLEAWPGMNTTDPQEKWHRPYIILPLSQEPEA